MATVASNSIPNPCCRCHYALAVSIHDEAYYPGGRVATLTPQRSSKSAQNKKTLVTKNIDLAVSLSLFQPHMAGRLTPPLGRIRTAAYTWWPFE